MSGEEIRARKRSVTLDGHRTSISLEPIFWDQLEEKAKARQVSLAALIAEIDRDRVAGGARANLSSTLRRWVVEQLLQERDQGVP